MDALAQLVAKDEIRELAQLYARGIDRKDMGLLRTLYTDDAIDNHGPYSSGPVDRYFAFLERSLPHMHIGSHHICNHLISIDGDRATGEVYAIAWHLIPDGKDGLAHDIQSVRYVDNYRREGERWLFAQRDVTFDMKMLLPAADHGDKPDPGQDVTYHMLRSALFARH